MLWHLLLAHFTADYPLQSNWMAKNKVRFWVLSLHVLIHLVTMLVLLLPASLAFWPYIAALAAIHFGIDTAKNWFTLHRPQWRAWPYLIDQACHLLSIGLVTAWINQAAPAAQPAVPWLPRPAAVVGIGFLLVTFVAMITERVLLSSRQMSAGNGSAGTGEPQAWSRLVARAALLSLLLVGWQLRPAQRQSQLPVGLALLLPYTATSGGTRLLLVDLLVTVVTALLVIVINGSWR